MGGEGGEGEVCSQQQGACSTMQHCRMPLFGAPHPPPLQWHTTHMVHPQDTPAQCRVGREVQRVGKASIKMLGDTCFTNYLLGVWHDRPRCLACSFR